MNIAYRCIDTFTVKVHDLHPVLEISNFLQMLNMDASAATTSTWFALKILYTNYPKQKKNAAGG